MLKQMTIASLLMLSLTACSSGSSDNPTNNQQPTTNNQQPTTNNQQPTINNQLVVL